MGIAGSCSSKPVTKGYSVGKKYDFKNDCISEVTVKNNIPILLAKYQGNLFAFGATCPHYGAPLASGVFADGKIRCPWHGACFDIKTGDIEDFPSVDCLPTYKVTEQKDGNVVVFCGDEMPSKIVRPLGKLKNKNKSIIIIGGGPAACIAAQTLRQNKYDGRITIISKEHHLPYDRTMINKMPGISIADVRLRDMDYYKSGNIEVLDLSECEKVDFNSQKVFIKKSSLVLQYDKLLIATGSKPKEISINGADLKNIRPIYSLEDGMNIRNEVGDREIVIIGATFIGLELAWALRDVCSKISVISNSEFPMAYLLGKKVASYIHKKALENCAILEFIGPDDVRCFVGNSHGEVIKVVTSRRGNIDAEYVILAMWPAPNSDLCVSSSSKMTVDESTKAIIVNQYMETSIKNVYAAGDVASFPLDIADDQVQIPYWSVACKHGQTAALNMIGVPTSITKIVPFFWASFFDLKLRICGYIKNCDEVVIFTDPKMGVETDICFCALYRKNKQLTGSVTVNCDPIASQLAADFAASMSVSITGYPSYVKDRFPDCKPIIELMEVD